MEKTLSILCNYLNNYFDRGRDKLYETVVIDSGSIVNESFSDKIQDGQYYRIIGSVFNDGVHKYDASLSDMGLKDETFNGSIWLMAIPQEVIDLATDIEAWQAQYEAVDSANMSPYQSESFGGYSYSKASTGGSSDGGAGTSITWQNAFKSRLSTWRKLKI